LKRRSERDKDIETNRKKEIYTEKKKMERNTCTKKKGKKKEKKMERLRST